MQGAVCSLIIQQIKIVNLAKDIPGKVFHFLQNGESEWICGTWLRTWGEAGRGSSRTPMFRQQCQSQCRFPQDNTHPSREGRGIKNSFVPLPQRLAIFKECLQRKTSPGENLWNITKFPSACPSFESLWQSLAFLMWEEEGQQWKQQQGHGHTSTTQLSSMHLQRLIAQSYWTFIIAYLAISTCKGLCGAACTCETDTGSAMGELGPLWSK